MVCFGIEIFVVRRSGSYYGSMCCMMAFVVIGWLTSKMREYLSINFHELRN